MRVSGVHWGLAAVAVAAMGAKALAQPAAKPEARAAVLQKLVDCRKITDSATRLACYDKAAGELDTAEAKGDVVVVDREQARTVRKQAFGFHLPSITLFEKGEKQEDIDTVTSKVASAKQNGAGHWIVKLEDGATWSQVDTTLLPFDPKPGQPVRIRRASLGSYIMTIGNQKGIKVHRDE